MPHEIQIKSIECKISQKLKYNNTNQLIKSEFFFFGELNDVL